MEPEKIRLIREALDLGAAYEEQAGNPPVAPDPASLDGLAAFATPVPEGPSDPSEVVARLHRFGSPGAVRSTGGRYFGFVTGGTEPAAAAASVLATVWDQNIALPAMSPVAAQIDRVTSGWVVDLLGLPTQSVATFCSGASVANLTCIVAARDALLMRAGWDVDAAGLAGAPPLRVVASSEIHASLYKALRVAGIGKEAIEYVPTDHLGRLDATALPTIDTMTLVLLQAGNVNTGHSDPFERVIPAVRAAGGWVHVDGAFGMWAAAAPDRRQHVAGVELADSWATDAHKWLNASYDSGLAICAREEDLRRAMAIDAAYVSTESDRALMHLNLQMSQRARAIETWAIIAAKGRSGIAEMIETSCRQAERLASLLSEAGVEVLAPPALNQTLVAFGDDTTTNRVIAAVQAEGTCWAGGTTWQRRRAMRLSVSDTGTSDDDIVRSAEAILRCWTAPGAVQDS